MHMNRKRAATLGQETLSILERGHYKIQNHTVRIKRELAKAVEGTISYPPDAALSSIAPGTHNTRFIVCNDTTLNAAKTLVVRGHRVAALNFASAKNPGGGFQGGSRAQEESLARSSGLFACIEGNAMYSHHRHQRGCMYSNYAIFSPDVPVFRHDEGELLTTPYLCSFITSPAVNAGVVRKRKEATARQIKEAMQERIDKVLTIAAVHEHDALVLGAWGCGVFRNDANEIATLFDQALSSTFRGVFRAITFAILDSSKQQRFIGPFLHTFGAQSQQCLSQE